MLLPLPSMDFKGTRQKRRSTLEIPVETGYIVRNMDSIQNMADVSQDGLKPDYYVG